MSLTTPDRIRTLQRKLYLKAKAEPNFRFYLLYDKVYRADILRHAYGLARANKGAAGVDGVDFAAIEAAGLENWLDGIATELRTKTYQPQPVRRVMIPKPGGGERPLGIPSIRDRVVQTAAKLVLEPIFEADLEPTAYGYRPGRSGIDAVKAVRTVHPGSRTQPSHRLQPLSVREDRDAAELHQSRRERVGPFLFAARPSTAKKRAPKDLLDPEGVVSVSDRGPGVASDDRAHIFDRFWRGRGARHTGAGLGLAIVAEIARAHGGTVEVDQATGGGALFTLKLRRA